MELVFTPEYTARDKKLYTFMVNTCIREYSRMGFHEPLKQMIFQTTPLKEAMKCNGITIFETDVIKLKAPNKIGLVDACGFGRVIAHELAHHLIQEHYGDSYLGNSYGNNLVHCASNDMHKQYFINKRYWSPSFMARYGLPYLKIALFDLKRLINDGEMWMAAVRMRKAPYGKDIYWY